MDMFSVFSSKWLISVVFPGNSLTAATLFQSAIIIYFIFLSQPLFQCECDDNVNDSCPPIVTLSLSLSLRLCREAASQCTLTAEGRESIFPAYEKPKFNTKYEKSHQTNKQNCVCKTSASLPLRLLFIAFSIINPFTGWVSPERRFLSLRAFS